MAIHYRQKLKNHLEELEKEGTISGPLDLVSSRAWILNPVITAKSWDSDKIRMNLDTRPMAKAVKTSNFPIPMPEELRHNFKGSNRFSNVDLNHCFHQFELGEESKE